MLPRPLAGRHGGAGRAPIACALMGTVNGYLNLGTAVYGNEVATPSRYANYNAQPISFNSINQGTLVSDVLCIFGPVSGSWGTLTSFGITDLYRNPLFASGLSVAIPTVNGQLIQVPPGAVSIVPTPGPPLQVSGGYVYAPTNPGLPAASGSLWPGAVWWTVSGFLGIVPGVTPNPLAPPTYLVDVSPSYFLVYGAGYLPVANPGIGSMQLWNASGLIAQA